MSERRDPQAVRIDVLVVDDEPDVASSTADILRSGGLVAATSATAEEALEVIAGHEVRCVILDHQLAGNEESFLGSGRELPPVIVMSGIGRAAIVRLQATHPADLFACLAKPVPPLELIEIVKRAIGEL
ncbi:MAG TPA: response regulator [Acidimicrobiales bacterium]|nr:response regulator [Acidimicrobiales bacterium]